MIVRGGPYRVGFTQGVSANDVNCVGGGGNQSCTNPTIPAGTATAHTRILGENYAACSTGGGTAVDKTKLTQVFGGYGLGQVLNLTGAQYVDVQCLDITSHSACFVHAALANGNTTFPPVSAYCNRGYPWSDFTSEGIRTDQGTANVFLKDIWIHGHTDRGVQGPLGGLLECLRCIVGVNGVVGWDFDDGTGCLSDGCTPVHPATPNLSGATWRFLYSTIEFSG